MFVSCMFVFRRINFQVQLIRSFYLNFTCAYLFFLFNKIASSSLLYLLLTDPPHSLTHSRSLTVHSLPYTVFHLPPFNPSHTVSHIHSFSYTYSGLLPKILVSDSLPFICSFTNFSRIFAALIKKKIKFSSYTRKFRMEQLQIHI